MRRDAGLVADVATVPVFFLVFNKLALYWRREILKRPKSPSGLSLDVPKRMLPTQVFRGPMTVLNNFLNNQFHHLFLYLVWFQLAQQCKINCPENKVIFIVIILSFYYYCCYCRYFTVTVARVAVNVVIQRHLCWESCEQVLGVFLKFSLCVRVNNNNNNNSNNNNNNNNK